MIGKDELAEIARYHDAEAEEHENMPGFWAKRDVDVDALLHVAQQRALRIIMMRKGMNPNQTRPTAVSLTSAEQHDEKFYALMYFDAFAAGMEAERRKHEGGNATRS